MAAVGVDKDKKSVFMYGTTEDEAEGKIGFPRRWRYKMFSPDDVVKMITVMSEDTDDNISAPAHDMLDLLSCSPCRTTEAVQLICKQISILSLSPESYLDFVVSDTDSDEDTTYEPDDAQREQERIARERWLEELAKAKEQNVEISFTTRELLALANTN